MAPLNTETAGGPTDIASAAQTESEQPMEDPDKQQLIEGEAGVAGEIGPDGVPIIKMPPKSKNEKNIINNISHKMKATFWNYYKDHKTEMIEEQSFSGSYFKDEHEFHSSASSEEGQENDKKKGQEH